MWEDVYLVEIPSMHVMINAVARNNSLWRNYKILVVNNIFSFYFVKGKGICYHIMGRNCLTRNLYWRINLKVLMRRNSCENFKVIQGHLLKSFKIKRGQDGEGDKLIPVEKLLSLAKSKTERKSLFSFRINRVLNSTHFIRDRLWKANKIWYQQKVRHHHVKWHA